MPKSRDLQSPPPAASLAALTEKNYSPPLSVDALTIERNPPIISTTIADSRVTTTLTMSPEFKTILAYWMWE